MDRLSAALRLASIPVTKKEIDAERALIATAKQGRRLLGKYRAVLPELDEVDLFEPDEPDPYVELDEPPELDPPDFDDLEPPDFDEIPEPPEFDEPEPPDSFDPGEPED